MNFAEQYVSLLDHVMFNGEVWISNVCFDMEIPIVEKNNRTNSLIRELSGGVSMKINLHDNVLPTCGVRKISPVTAAAENAWCILGHNHIDWLRTHTRVWDQFADVMECRECDGRGHGDFADQDCDVCGGSGNVYWLNQAYGNRWKHTFGVDQLIAGLNRLTRDPSDRRVWISSWDPSNDITSDGHTVPCPVGFTLSITNGRLNSSLMIRSSDIVMGLPHDVMRHTFLMWAVAETLNTNMGYMQITLAHPHVYEKHWEVANLMRQQILVIPKFMRVRWPVDRIFATPDAYVHEIRKTTHTWATEWPTFRPKMEVVP